MRLQLCLILELGKEVVVETKTVLVRTPPLVESILCLQKKAEHHLNAAQHSRVHCSREHRRHAKPVPQRMNVHAGHTCTTSGMASRASLKQGTPTLFPAAVSSKLGFGGDPAELYSTSYDERLLAEHGGDSTNLCSSARGQEKEASN
ncbi:hypothetical protein GOP47_0017316 [Adiantum capillus-veneris]|uniref:Uncharacterized protein n=1 Tax=Adiantum capillus-veneris TaxID=13818 RepID=A0A9D4Z921_ADICA|nr:hypothetical protein GOP47_0017316 [Adiantum capillus-veneris]